MIPCHNECKRGDFIKKLVVFLFPSKHFTSIQEEYIKEELDDNNFRISDIFDRIISERYKNKGFEFAVAQYKNEEVSGINTIPDKTVFANASYMDFYNRDEEVIEKDYDYIAAELHPELYDIVIVGGYHSTDCVLKLTKSINNVSNNAYVDRDLTNDFTKTVFMREKDRIIGINNTFEFTNTNMLQFTEFNHKLREEDPYDQSRVVNVVSGIKR